MSGAMSARRDLGAIFMSVTYVRLPQGLVATLV